MFLTFSTVWLALPLFPLLLGLGFGLAKFASVAVLPLVSLPLAWLCGAGALFASRHGVRN